MASGRSVDVEVVVEKNGSDFRRCCIVLWIRILIVVSQYRWLIKWRGTKSKQLDYIRGHHSMITAKSNSRVLQLQFFHERSKLQR